MKSKKYIPTCNVCKHTPGINVRERKPGTQGTMAQSFLSHYHLCADCLVVCRKVGAIDEWRDKSVKPRREERVTVLAKTYAWLVIMKQGHL